MSVKKNNKKSTKKITKITAKSVKKVLKKAVKKPVIIKKLAKKPIKKPLKPILKKAKKSLAKVVVKAVSKKEKAVKKIASKASNKIKQKKILAKKPEKLKKIKKIVIKKPEKISAKKLEKLLIKIEKKPAEIAVVKSINKPAKVATFKVGDYAVYPSHGIGKIIEIENATVLGEDFSCYLMYFEKEKLTIKVPVRNSEKIGLRSLVSKSQMDEVFSILRSGIKKMKGMWSRRAQEYESKINSGNIIFLAEVLRDLTRDIEDGERSYSERIIYETAVSRLAIEYAAIYKVDFEEAKGKVVITAKDKLISEGKVQEGDFDYTAKIKSDDIDEEEIEEEEEDEDEDESYGDYDDEDDDDKPRKKRKK